MIRSHYKPIPAPELALDRCGIVSCFNPPAICLDDPAIQVMTDLRLIPAATIDQHLSLEEAAHRMSSRNVRLLFVSNESRHIAGIVTAWDISGERPVTEANGRGLRVSDLSVQDIMTPLTRSPLIHIIAVHHAEVGNILATLKAAHSRYALVLDWDDAGSVVICGLFAASQIAKQLGIPEESLI